MNAGAPHPSIRIAGDTLWVAYVCSNPEFPGWDGDAPLDHPGFAVWSALLQFNGVQEYHLGAPNDERLHTHPLYFAGLSYYRFYEAIGTNKLKTASAKRHWLATFHDETLEVIADSALVLRTKIDGEDTQSIVKTFMP